MGEPTHRPSAEASAGGTAEFDDYSRGYDAGFDAPFKRLAGGRPESYIEWKARWLLDDLSRRPLQTNTPDLLDLGCGNALLLRELQRLGCRAKLHGCDVSDGMLDEARRTWPHKDVPALVKSDTGRVPFDDHRFDIVVVSAVLHHVEPAQRADFYRELWRVVKPSGRAVVFEHNPYNPLVRYIVNRTPIDANAILLQPKEVRAAFAGLGAEAIRTDYLMFVPPRLMFLRRAERLLQWLPLGGQYAVTASKPH